MNIISHYGYSVIARIFPTIIGLIPFFIFQYVFLGNFIHIDSILVSVTGNISLSTILVYAFNQYFVRLPSKIFEDYLFKKQLHFPTTNFLMFSDKEYTTDLKNAVRKSVLQDFSIVMPDKTMEKRNENEARKRIKEAVRLIIGKVKDGYLVLQHNIEYGFVRNLWGASLVGMLGSLMLIRFAYPDSVLEKIGEYLFSLYLLYTVFGFMVIKYFGRAYARKLIEEYCKV